MGLSLKLLFRIVYAALYTFLHLLLVGLFLVPPADIVNQSRLRHNLYPILIVSICYVASIVIVLFVYFLRLYINRSVINSIPKSWVAIEKGDVRKPVRKMIAACLSRSAAIALVSQPRYLLPDQFSFEVSHKGATEHLIMSGAGGGGGEDGSRRDEKPEEDNAIAEIEPKRIHNRLKKRTETIEQEMGIDLPPCKLVWGHIEHPGWAPPDAVDMGDLQYSTVLTELPNLIEAKAMTLAPPDPMASPAEEGGLPLPFDPEAVELLQRPIYMGVRDYLMHLTQLGVLDLAGDGDEGRDMAAVVTSFVSTYEYARFSTQMLSHESFRQLMHNLATILRRMGPLDPAVLFYDSDDGMDSEEERQYEAEKYGGQFGDEPSYPRFGNGQYQHDNGNEKFSHQLPGNDSANTPIMHKHFLRDTDSGNGTESDIDNNAARSSPTTPRSTSRRSSSYFPPNQSVHPQEHRQRQRSGTVLRHGQPDEIYALSRMSSNGSGYSAGSSAGTEGTTGHVLGVPQSPSSPTATAAFRPQRQHNYDTYLDLPTTPTTPKRRQANVQQADTASLSSSSSGNSFAQSRQPFRVAGQPTATASQTSLQSASSNGSVIRLADHGDASELPYVLNRIGTRVYGGT